MRAVGASKSQQVAIAELGNAQILTWQAECRPCPISEAADGRYPTLRECKDAFTILLHSANSAVRR